MEGVKEWHTSRHWDPGHGAHTRHWWCQHGGHAIGYVCMRAVCSQESGLCRDERPSVTPSGVGQVGARQGQLQQQTAQVVGGVADLPCLLLQISPGKREQAGQGGGVVYEHS